MRLQHGGGRFMSANIVEKLRILKGKLPKWDTPAPNMCLTLKEWVMYLIGGFGGLGATVLMTYVTITQGVYVAAACNINVDHVAIIGIASSVFTIATTPLVSWLIDNTRTRFGKFRPYLLIIPLPMTACFFAIGQIVKIDDYLTLVILFTIIYNILTLLNRLYTIAFNSIPQVISPNMNERIQLMSIGTFAISLGPTIANFLYPVIANRLYSSPGSMSDGVHSIGAYEWALPLTVGVFMLLGVFLALGVKERIVVPSSFRQRQTFIDGCRKTFKNKYFWILNISNLLGIMKLTANGLALWYVAYDIAPDLTARGLGDLASVTHSLVTLVLGTASVPGMLLAPLVINKIGKKKLILISNFGIAAASIPMLFIPNSWVHIVCVYVLTLFNSFQIVTGPACQAEINDFQQYETGDRIEGFLGQFGTIFLTAASMGTAFIGPAIQKAFGYVDDASVLYNKDVLFGITSRIAAVGLLSAVLAAIPYFFWDMTEAKHKSIMEVLKIRAATADGKLPEDVSASLEERAMQGETGLADRYLTDNAENAPDEERHEDVAASENERNK